LRWDGSKWKPKLSRQELERRRISAAKDLQKEMTQSDVARKYDVNPSSVCRWNKALKEKGLEGVKRRKAPGAKSKLSEEQQHKLREIIFKGAATYGYKTDLWTLRRVAEVIQEEFKVSYHFRSLSDVLHRMGLSPQKPKRRAAERNQTAVQQWLDGQWKNDQKN
jgi:transposase